VTVYRLQSYDAVDLLFNFCGLDWAWRCLLLASPRAFCYRPLVSILPFCYSKCYSSNVILSNAIYYHRAPYYRPLATIFPRQTLFAIHQTTRYYWLISLCILLLAYNCHSAIHPTLFAIHQMPFHRTSLCYSPPAVHRTRPAFRFCYLFAIWLLIKHLFTTPKDNR
jgi:hypothetical protein